MTLTLACVVPTHLRAADLSQALQSIRAQSVPPNEVFVVDDVDDEATAAVVDRIGESAGFPIRRIINAGGSGASSSRNAGAHAASAQFVAFLDDDDIWLPGYLEHVIGALTRNEPQPDAIITGMRRVRENGKHQSIVMPPTVELSSLYVANPGMTGSNIVVRHDTFTEIGGFDQGLPVRNDLDFLVRFVAAGKTYTVVPETLVEWRDHPGDRITFHGPRHASGVEEFLRKYESVMTPAQCKEVVARSLGSRRRGAKSLQERLYYTWKLFRLLGLRETTRRQLTDIHNAIRKEK